MQSSNLSEGASRTYRIRVAAYWLVTLLVAYELVASFVWSLVGTQYVAASLKRLGYPLYIQTILGTFDLPGAVVLVVPLFRRLKEWAYAGAFFKYSGAVASHALVGHGPDRWAAPLVFALLTLASWALRPAERRMMPPPDTADTPTRAWLVAGFVIVGLVLASLFTVPQ